MGKKSLKRFNLITAILLSIGVILYVVLNLELEDIYRIFLSLNFPVLLAAFGVYLLNYLFRMIRFRILLGLDQIPILPLLGVTHLYGMYLYLMPAKFGEITFPFLLKRRLKVDIITSTGSLIVARIFDFFSIAIILILVLIVYWDIVPFNLRIGSVVFSGLVVGGFIFFRWMVRNPSKVTGFLEKGQTGRRLVQKISDFIVGVYQGARTVEKQNKYQLLVALSLAIWFCVNANFYLITVSLGYSFNFFQIMVVSIIMIPVTLFPIQGFANIGAHELGWVTVFTIFDYPYQAAMNIAVSSHIIHVLFVLLLGLIGVILMSAPKKTAAIS